ncbi:hypothetical protein EGM70_11860 [Enterobacteriaceae bacterium 89]|nr:hypothetical protein [Enterobacteriaceae bacterium 89]
MRYGMMAVSFAALLTAHAAQAAPPQNYLYTSSGELEEHSALLARPDIQGVQIVYSWKQLETAKDVYDFSAIERDLAQADALHKKLFIQIQDRFFEPTARGIPVYLQTPAYGGGLVAQTDNPGEGKAEAQGWVAMQWNPQLRERYQKLLTALAAKFDGRVAGVNLPETAIDIDMKDPKSGFTCDRYFAATLDNIQFARKAFHQSHVVQYVNFWPCEWDNDHQYMSRLFEVAQKNKIGLGGPDIVPYKEVQMKNAYQFFHQYKGKLDLVAMAVQEATLTYTNPKTHKKFTREEFTDFAENYLGTNIIFWSTQSPWLKQPVR